MKRAEALDYKTSKKFSHKGTKKNIKLSFYSFLQRERLLFEFGAVPLAAIYKVVVVFYPYQRYLFVNAHYRGQEYLEHGRGNVSTLYVDEFLPAVVAYSEGVFPRKGATALVSVGHSIDIQFFKLLLQKCHCLRGKLVCKIVNLFLVVYPAEKHRAVFVYFRLGIGVVGIPGITREGEFIKIRGVFVYVLCKIVKMDVFIEIVSIKDQRIGRMLYYHVGGLPVAATRRVSVVFQAIGEESIILNFVGSIGYIAHGIIKAQYFPTVSPCAHILPVAFYFFGCKMAFISCKGT